MNYFKDYLKRRIKRNKEKALQDDLKYENKEMEFTFWGGFQSGYTRGRISAFEDILDEIECLK